MNYLEKYLDQKNIWNRLAKKPILVANNLTDVQAQDIFNMLDCDLSPENLCSDGEASKAEVARRFKLFNGAMKDLQKKGFVNTYL